MKYIFYVLFAFLTASMGSVCFAETYKKCQITMGKPVFCDGPYSGLAIIKKNGGSVEECSISIGSVSFCNGPYTGRAVLKKFSNVMYQLVA